MVSLGFLVLYLLQGYFLGGGFLYFPLTILFEGVVLVTRVVFGFGGVVIVLLLFLV